MFIQTEATADPARLKFLPGRPVLAEGTVAFRDKREAAASPLAERLFDIAGVAHVSFGTDWIVVAKDGGDWRLLRAAILGAIMDHFVSGAPTLRDHGAATTPSATAEPAEGSAASPDPIRDALRRVIDPELGYNIVDLGLVYDVTAAADGIVHVTMTTTTPGCPATGYLQQGAGEAARAVPGVARVDVTLTYEPRWTPEMMSPQAKAHFGLREG